MQRFYATCYCLCVFQLSATAENLENLFFFQIGLIKVLLDVRYHIIFGAVPLQNTKIFELYKIKSYSGFVGL